MIVATMHLRERMGAHWTGRLLAGLMAIAMVAGCRTVLITPNPEYNAPVIFRTIVEIGDFTYRPKWRSKSFGGYGNAREIRYYVYLDKPVTTYVRQWLKSELGDSGIRVGNGNFIVDGEIDYIAHPRMGTSITFSVWEKTKGQLVYRRKHELPPRKSRRYLTGNGANSKHTQSQTGMVVRDFVASFYSYLDKVPETSDVAPATKVRKSTAYQSEHAQTEDPRPNLDLSNNRDTTWPDQHIDRSSRLAVMSIIDSSNKFQADDLLNATGMLRGRLSATRRFVVIDKSRQERKLTELMNNNKQDSYKECYDKSCQIPLGQALAADSILRSTITCLGDSCQLSVEIIDLAKEASINGAIVDFPPSLNGLAGAIRAVVENLTR